MTALHPGFGATVVSGGVRFRLWAPGARRAEVVFTRGGEIAMDAEPDGYFRAVVRDAAPGDRYQYRVDGLLIPDPASRYQPEGVHGPSEVVDPRAYHWQDGGWTGRALESLVFYELHVGTFTARGTFDGVRERLPDLRDLGITAIELMPVADFPGRWNWGYDAAAMFAPARAYGRPDDLRRLVDAAHRLGLAVVLDVVYNHFGPDGAYAVAVAPVFLSSRHRTPWGPAVNLDGEAAGAVRAFFIENALHWLHEYHIDGLRLDATHTLVDDSPRHFLVELAAEVRAAGGRPRLLIAEDNRNLGRLVRPLEQSGDGLDAVWSDDYHHEVRCVLTGEQDGYFADYTRSTDELATIIRRGWLYAGQMSRHFRGPRGTDPEGIQASRFIHFIQNHDQIANRPAGERLSRVIAPAAYRAVSALLLCGPQTPLLFMGQEWAASSPFLYFTDHAGELGRQVSRGRQREFATFPKVAEIPDPQDPRTFERSRLHWEERAAAPHAGVLRCYRDLLAWRPRLAGLDADAASPTDGAIELRRGPYLILAALRGGASLPCPDDAALVWQSEDPAYAAHPDPPVRGAGMLHFGGPATVILERAR